MARGPLGALDKHHDVKSGGGHVRSFTKNTLQRMMRDFAGHVARDAKRAGLIDADAYVVPAFSGHFSVVVAEALASGPAVIGSRNLSQWAEVGSRNCELWAENDPDSRVATIRKKRTMDLSAMGRNGWQWITEDLSWEEAVKEMHIVYGTLVR